MKNLKELIKMESAQLRAFSIAIKEVQKAGKYAGKLQFERQMLRVTHRRNHIAYSLNRGKTYEQIEKPRKENEITERQWEIIRRIQDEHKNVCVSEPATGANL